MSILSTISRLMLILLNTPYLVLFFFDYRLMLFQMMLSLILLYMLIILVKVDLSVIRSVI